MHCREQAKLVNRDEKLGKSYIAEVYKDTEFDFNI